MNEALWNKCAEFHGHKCPGLATGFRVATEAMAKLGLDGPEADEELVCVTMFWSSCLLLYLKSDY